MPAGECRSWLAPDECPCTLLGIPALYPWPWVHVAEAERVQETAAGMAGSSVGRGGAGLVRR